VLDVLRSKHPDATSPVISSLHPYDVTPDVCDLDVTHGMIEQVARNLPGSSGLGGVDSQALSQWLLEFGNASVALHHSQTSPAGWLTPYRYRRITEHYGRDVC
jgi:hypothetical protein